MKEDQEGIKAQVGDAQGTPLIYSRRPKHLSLGMPKASPSSSTNHQVVSVETIFLLLYILCAIIGASLCFCFQFVLFCLLVIAMLDPSILVWERDTLRFFIEYSCSSLIFVEYLAFVLFSSCFSLISCYELLVSFIESV